MPWRSSSCRYLRASRTRSRPSVGGLNSAGRLRFRVPDRSEDLQHVVRVDLRDRSAADAGEGCSMLRRQSCVPPAARATGAGLPERPCGRRVATHGPLAPPTTTSGDPGQSAAQGGDLNPCPVRPPSTRPPSPQGGRVGKKSRAVRAFLAALSAARDGDEGPTNSIHQRLRRPTLEKSRRTTKDGRQSTAGRPATTALRCCAARSEC